MSIIFICILYCPGLPLLCISTLLFLVVQYWVDKYLILKHCRTPPNFDDQLETMVRQIFWVIIPFHLIFAIWIFGNPDLFVEDSQFILNSDSINNAKDTTQSQIFDRFQSQGYIQEFG